MTRVHFERFLVNKRPCVDTDVSYMVKYEERTMDTQYLS